MQLKSLRAVGPLRSRRSVRVCATAEPATTAAAARVTVSGSGFYTVKGTSRKINEVRDLAHLCDSLHLPSEAD